MKLKTKTSFEIEMTVTELLESAAQQVLGDFPGSTDLLGTEAGDKIGPVRIAWANEELVCDGRDTLVTITWDAETATDTLADPPNDDVPEEDEDND